MIEYKNECQQLVNAQVIPVISCLVWKMVESDGFREPGVSMAGRNYPESRWKSSVLKAKAGLGTELNQFD